jgi:TrmH family RNA methyltransferase
MSNFGFSSLRVVKPYEQAFREARSAVGAASILAEAEEYSGLDQAVADCSLVVGTTAAHNRELKHTLRPLESGASMIRKRLMLGTVALLFGSEKTGLSNKELSQCEWLLRIPTQEQHGSMNLGQAVAVCLYEVIREHGADSLERMPKRATAAELDRMTTLLVESARRSGYLSAESESSGEEKIRRLVHRLNLSGQDVNVWLGILRQTLWKLKS